VALDLQIIQPQNAIPVSRTTLVTIGGLRALDVLGSDFRSVDTVYINDVESPDVIVVSATRLLAQLPSSLQSFPDVQSVQVLSRQLTLSKSSVLRFIIGDTPGTVFGILRLLQLFVKVLLSEPGSDIFNKTLGGALLRSVGTTFGSEEGDNIRTNALIAVDRTSRQIISIQSRNGTLPRDERLLSAKLMGATFSRASTSMFLSIEVMSQTGVPARMNMEL
jgi:hypothetical protein